MESLTIRFEKSRSQNYARACALVERLGGAVDDDGTAVLVLKTAAVREHGEDVVSLMEIIRTWKTTAITLGRTRFSAFHIWMEVRKLLDCYDAYETSVNQRRYCSQPREHRGVATGFGCRLLDDLIGWGKEAWWECGDIDGKGVFHVDKKRLLWVLNVEAEKKALNLCPAFDFERVRELVEKVFPDTINPEIDKGWRYVSEHGMRVGVEPRDEYSSGGIGVRVNVGETDDEDSDDDTRSIQ